jgi:hypothetical protein
MLILKLEKKDGTIEELAVRELPAVLGRLGRSNVRIDDASVSREHARLFESAGKVYIADLNSSNGTFVNNKRVTRSEVSPGDAIRLGRAKLSLSRPEPGGEARGAVPAAEEFEIEEPPRDPAPAAEAAPPRAAPEKPGPAEARPVQPVRPAAAGAGAKGAAAKRAAAGQAGGTESVQVRDRILQYRRIPTDRKTGFLRSDFFQHHPATRLVAIIIILALAAGLFLISRWLTQTAMPAPWEGDEGGYEDTFDKVDQGE